MNVTEVMQALAALGNPNTKKVLLKHGAPEPVFGVKVGDLKKLVKKIKKDHALSIALFKTDNSDAKYLAGLIADEKQISKKTLQEWVQRADWYMLSEYTVAWIAADSPHGWELGLEWIESDNEQIATAGWSTLNNVISVKPDEELDTQKVRDLLERVEKNVHSAPNRVRYVMNGFVIGVGSFLGELTDRAMEVGKNIGKVKVEMGGTACKVPDAVPYIQKVIDKGRIGKKRKMARC